MFILTGVISQNLPKYSADDLLYGRDTQRN